MPILRRNWYRLSVSSSCNHLAVDPDRALRRLLLPADQPQQGGFAAAARPEDSDDLTAGNIEVEPLENFAFAVIELDVGDFD
jgi:hypothetical protein